MNQHITGPWSLSVDSKFPRVATVVGPQGKDLEIIAAISNETEMATLRLIAAAPEMLVLLKAIGIEIALGGVSLSAEKEINRIIATVEGA